MRWTTYWVYLGQEMLDLTAIESSAAAPSDALLLLLCGVPRPSFTNFTAVPACTGLPLLPLWSATLAGLLQPPPTLSEMLCSSLTQ